MLKSIYARRLDSAAAYRNRVWRVLVTEYFQRWIPRDGSVLDLGCGYGDFVNHVECQERLALDVNPEAARRLRGGTHLVVQDATLPWPLPDDYLDAVFTSNFLEHLPTKTAVASVILEARRSLKPGGLFLALGPNIRHVGGAYWDFWDHHIPLSERALRELLEVSGFRIELCLDRFLPYTMVNRRQVPLRLISTYLRCPLLWKFMGKQFFVVARKHIDHD